MRSATLPNALAGSTGTSCSLSFFTSRMQLCNTISCRPRFLSKILALSTNDIKVGSNIEVDGAPWRVMEFLHVKPGKGAAFVRTKLRNYVSGNTVDKTFRAGASSTFDESRLSEREIGDKKKWLKEGMECNVLSWNGRIIDVDFPITVKYKVTEAESGVKGDTVQGGSKLVTLETGAVVTVPLFVNLGDDILVDTRTGTYTSRA